MLRKICLLTYLQRAKPASKLEMTQFHADDYVDFLSKVTHENMGSMQKEQMRFNVGDDSPVFDGMSCFRVECLQFRGFRK
jgi:acetoin utilization deacetylase AcuC-like enzyme